MLRFRKTLIVFVLGLTALLFNSCLQSCKSKSQPPKLAVVIVVDQMRPDHLTRFASLYEGGLARLLAEGAIYEEAHHDHAATETAVGHATISSGVFPSKHGIIGNDFYQRSIKKNVYAAEDSASKILGAPEMSGRSPLLLQTSTIGEWLKAANSNSKVFAVARKDRSAIMMAGHHPDGAYWYNSRNGQFITSTYYRQDYPEWVQSFNAAGHADVYFENGWERAFPADAYHLAHEDDFPFEYDGVHTTFPHRFSDFSEAPDSRYYSMLTATPFGDELVFKFAKELFINENIGSDEHPDLLFIGCSAADAIGHAFGPNSQEAEDYYLRLDQYLADVFAFLDERVGKQNYTVVLSSDHGVLPLPEELARRGFPARRLPSDSVRQVVNDAVAAVAAELALPASPVFGYNHGLLCDYTVLPAHVTQSEFEQALTAKLQELDFIAEVFTRDELAAGATDGRALMELYVHNYYPDRGADVILCPKEYTLITSSKFGTSHGSPYHYDTHVPLVFAGAGISPARHEEKVRTVDIAPTLAALLGLTPPPDLDGRNLLGNGN